MTGTDPLTAIIDQLAAHAEQLTRLDTRETDHHTTAANRLAELAGQQPVSPASFTSTLPPSVTSPYPLRPAPAPTATAQTLPLPGGS